MRFSVMASQQSIGCAGTSCLSAYRLPTATALPSMSVCMSCMPLWGFRFVPPVSKQIPLPTRASSARGVALRDGEKGPGAEPAQGPLAVEAVSQAEAPGELFEQAAVAARIEH